MADKIVVLRNGNVEQVGAPLELYDRPANTFVAQFIGSPAMNLIAGVVAGSKICLADGMLVAVQSALQENQEVTLGIRPEHLHLAPEGIPAEIVLVEPLGMTTQIAVKALGQILTLMAMNRTTPAIGEKVHVSWEPEHMRIFDRSTRMRHQTN